MFVAERFLSGLVKDYGKHPASRLDSSLQQVLQIIKKSIKIESILNMVK